MNTWEVSLEILQIILTKDEKNINSLLIPEKTQQILFCFQAIHERICELQSFKPIALQCLTSDNFAYSLRLSKIVLQNQSLSDLSLLEKTDTVLITFEKIYSETLELESFKVISNVEPPNQIPLILETDINSAKVSSGRFVTSGPPVSCPRNKPRCPGKNSGDSCPRGDRRCPNT